MALWIGLMEDNLQASARPAVLLVDDDDGVRRSLQLLLQGNGFHVRSYGTGAALLADPAAMSAMCLIADYRLPEIDGMAVLQELRRRGWAGSALLISGFVSPDLTAGALAAGFSSVLAKPLRDRSIAAALSGAISMQADQLGSRL